MRRWRTRLGALDFYIWVVWKSWSFNGPPVHIPIFSSGALSKQLGSKPYSVARTFRPVLANWLRKIKGLWPRHLPRWQLSDCHLFTEVPSHQLRAKVSSPVGLPTCSCQLIYLQNDTCTRDLHRGSSDEVLTSARTGYAGSCCPSAGDQEPRKKVRRIVMRV